MKSYKAISKAVRLSESHYLQMEKDFFRKDLSRSGQTSKKSSKDTEMTHLGSHTKSMRTSKKDLRASFTSIEFSIYDSTIRKILAENGIHWRVVRQKPQLTQKNIKVHFNTP